MSQKSRWPVVFRLALLLIFVAAGQGHAQLQDVVDSKETQKVIVYKGDVVTLKVYSLTRLALTVPGIVEMSKVEVDQILLVGQAEGETTLFVWDEFGKRKIDINVILEDLDRTVERLNALLVSAKIKGLNLRKNMEEKKVIITGKVPKDKKETYQKLLDPFVMSVLDLTTESGELIQIDVQITELTTTLTKTMGVLWSAGTAGLSLPYQETLPAFDGSLGDLFKIGDFQRTSAIQATVNMLLSEGKARVLSKPSIIVTSGEAATFLVGGEIPIRTTTVSEGNITENISYKAYGVDLTVSPTIDADKIDLDLNVSIRDVDASNAVGEDTAFTTRSANTKLMLNDGQTIILAGLIKSNKGEQVTRVPFLSKIPIVGALFRSKSWSPNREEEVVISLTPKILKDDKTSPAPMPSSVVKESVRQEDGKDWRYQEAGDATLAEQDLQLIKGPASSHNLSEELTRDVPVPLADPLGPPSGRSQAITAYAQEIQKKISRAVSFPQRAQERGWEGVVTLSLDILRDGSLVDVSVEESSGYEVLDTDAVNTSQLSAPFEPFPDDLVLEELRLTLPIIYSQESMVDEILWR